MVGYYSISNFKKYLFCKDPFYTVPSGSCVCVGVSIYIVAKIRVEYDIIVYWNKDKT